ncbi:MAG TPA: tetratricopeptide repeat-containing serine protease family protein [Pyrinomonadaceae bacterium]|nr:tetratricopeptide repeat-containing serine protease family protein [Pyrinomonadaceae bacterium]
MKRTIPRLVTVLSFFVIAQVSRAQEIPTDLTGGVSNPRTAAASSASAGQTLAPAESLPDLVRRVKPSVVSVLTYDSKGEPLISGTGFFVRAGELVTNMHVIKNAHRVEIHTLEGKGRTYPVAGALAVDEEADLALLRVDLPAERSRPLAMTASLPDEGEPVFLIGNPLRLEGSVSDGIVSAIREVPDLGRIIQITAPVSHGNSGSPLFNMRGQVIGIVTVKVTNGQNINLALGVSRIVSLARGELMSFDQISTRNKAATQPESLAELWYRGGIDSLWLGNYDSALNYFETAANRNPRRPETWIQIGYCKVKQGRNEEAIRAYKRALQLRPSSAEAYNKLGDAYFFGGRFDEAIASYKQAARLQPDQPDAYYNLGLAYLEIGDRESALAQSRLLEPLDPDLNKKLLAELQR